MGMKVWIDQDPCTGCGLCEESAPSVFKLVDGLSHVKDGNEVLKPGGLDALAKVPPELEQTTLDAAEECPGQCVFIEVE